MNLLFPKPRKIKKRQRHPASIIHAKDGTCFLCMLLDGDYSSKITEEHHIFHGNPNRRLSEDYGLKAYLCIAHHREGPKAVHKNRETDIILKKIAKTQFERYYPDKDFRAIFGKEDWI